MAQDVLWQIQSLVLSYAYTHDKVGNRKTLSDGWGQHAYDYDPTYQLTEADYPQGFSFEDLAEVVYDTVYNREEMTSGQTTISYLANSLHQYASVNAVAYTYDDNGNLTYDGNQRYVYDAENRLAEVRTPTDVLVASYAYDSFGRRLSKTVAATGVTTTYVYDGPHVVAEYEDSGSGAILARTYLYGPGIDEPICMMDLTGQSPAIYFYFVDGLGSVTALLNMNGQIIERYVYDVFGKTQILDAGLSVLSASAVGNPILFTGRRWDDESGLYDYRARMYSPELGRFLQPDPIGYADGMNLYAYCGNNPINFVDSLGLAPNNDESGDKDRLRRAIERYIRMHPGLSNHQLIDGLKKYMQENGYAGGYNLYGLRYFNTNDGTTIDLYHFAAAADYGQWWFGGEVIGNLLGWINEISQAIRCDPSGRPFGGNEDLASNAAGADFGDEYLENGPKSLTDQILDYLEKIHGGVTDDKPNFGSGEECNNSSSSRLFIH